MHHHPRETSVGAHLKILLQLTASRMLRKYVNAVSRTCIISDMPQFGALCIGIGESMNINRTEDCLFINVYTPNNATRSSKLPVWVYIPGGGYAKETNSNYNATDVVRASGQNIVFVNFNYRVSAYGFLASKKVREDGDLNVGLLDQRKALYWVKKYIAQVSRAASTSNELH